MSMAKKAPAKNESIEPEQAARTAFERVQLARHPDRPYALDFIERLFDDFVELHGDRRYADDPAIVCGLAPGSCADTWIVGNSISGSGATGRSG